MLLQEKTYTLTSVACIRFEHLMLLMQILVVTLKVPAASALKLPEFQTLPVLLKRMERCEVVHPFLFASKNGLTNRNSETLSHLVIWEIFPEPKKRAENKMPFRILVAQRLFIKV